jgi:site-specific recombinase XerD
MLSRQAMRATNNTLKFYEYTGGNFIAWLESQSLQSPQEITARHVRAYLSELIARQLSDSTVNCHARAMRTMLKFWHAENYMRDVVKFAMPKIEKKSLSVRDKALILLMVDTGLRRSEIIALNWQDVDFGTGLVQVVRGKGGKARVVVIGAIARRALLAYRRTLKIDVAVPPLIQTNSGIRFTSDGFSQVFRRISKLTGIHVTPHSLRRSFVILSLRSGMDVLHLQALLGHSTLAMVQHYAQMQDVDLIQAHNAYSPIDNLQRLKK